MPNLEREEDAAARDRLGTATREGLRQAVLAARNDVEVPLRDALRIVRVLGMVETPRSGDDARAIAYVAREAAIRLELVTDELRGLFGACIAEF
ncbi:MAG TPA: hypothetical protein VG889_18605 [Rhizomicrobium sp.]|nr:hypothetical protein [Rhizomicrobium sp.]